LWTASQKKLAKDYSSDPLPPGDADVSEAAPSRQRAFGSVVWDHAGTLLWSAGLTILLAVTAFPLAVLLGALVALLRHSGPRVLRPVLTAYVEFLRGTPLLLQLYVIFFLLPEWGLRLPALATAILGLGLNYSAYESEIFRAGLAAIPKGQEEAAAALGLSRLQTLRYVIAPQTLRVVLPPMANDFIALFKDTSVCSVITIVELTKRYSVLSMSTQATLELTLATAVLYLAMSLPASALAKRIERRLARRPLALEEQHAARS
jgi:polar amino acid transport system substrate-binding protein